MPTVHRQDGFRLVIYTKDRQPAHVHCRRGASRIVLNLPMGDEGPTIRQVNRATKFNDLVEALRIVNEHQAKLWDAWRRYHAN